MARQEKAKQGSFRVESGTRTITSPSPTVPMLVVPILTLILKFYVKICDFLSIFVRLQKTLLVPFLRYVIGEIVHPR